MSGFTKQDLERESQSELGQGHMCTNNIHPHHLKIYRVKKIAGKAQKHWELFSLWLATPEDVANGDASHEDEVLNLSSIEIEFCPFCGTQLTQ